MFSTLRYIARRISVKSGYQNFAVIHYFSDVSQSKLPQHENKRINSRPIYGQPTPSSHPHLMTDKEIIPGISVDEFKHRRSKLAELIRMSSNAESQIVIIPSSTKVYMSEKIPYVFRQNTDFLYFSGCQEPNSTFVLTLVGDVTTCTLFINQKDQHAELWEGPRTGIEAAPELFGVDQALPVTEFERFFMSFVNEHKNSIIWYDQVNIIQPYLHNKLHELLQRSRNQKVISPKLFFHQIRAIKSPCEINLMKKSCDIASMAIKKTIQKSKPGMTEHQLFAIVDYECRMNGAEYLAYPPVVASGNNANIIHYIANNQMIQDGNMVLMDAGCEYHGYTSDISRTWPVNGTFTAEQRILYEIVLDVQKELIKQLREMPTLDQLFHDMCTMLSKRLQEIGLIPKSWSVEKSRSAAYTYCPHHVSHYLGMDVHDTGKLATNIKVQPGMIITIEPGIYVNPQNSLAPPNFHGLGIRIEDDVLIRDGDPLILSRKCPKEINDIETLARES